MKTRVKSFLRIALAIVLVICLMPLNTVHAEGTEVPYEISTLEDLKAFRDAVNNGYSYEGETVILTADIDMKGEDWSVNIGDDCNTSFKGTFDGQNHTISNLTGTETAGKSDGYFCTGLFGSIRGNAVVKNLTISGATINTGSFVGNNAGVAVGFAYNCTGSVQNVHVVNSTINATGITATGAIVGYGYSGNLSVSNCSVKNSTINGASYVGGIVGYGSNNHTIANCTAEDVTVTGQGGAVGGVVGIMLKGATVTGTTVKDVAVTAQHENWKNSAAAVVGTITETVTVDATIENVTANGEKAPVVGSEHQNKPTTPVAKVEAAVGNVYYKTFAAAMAAAKEGDTITLQADITASEVILLSKSLTINGNGHKVTSTASRVFRVDTSNVEITLNNVNMVSKAVRVGTNDIRGISVDANLSNIKLTLNSCSLDFTHESANDWAFAVNVSGNGTGHTLTVNGGTYEGANVVNVHGAKNTVTVKNATLNSQYPNSDVASNFGACIWVLQNQGSKVEATGNTFNGNNAVAFNLGTGTTLTESGNTDNTKRYCVAKIDKKAYGSLAAAFEGAQDGDTIVLVTDTEQTETIKNNKNIALDLNGKTITGIDNETKSFSVIEIQPGAELTVKDSVGGGKITLTSKNNRGWNAFSSVISNQRGKLIVNSGTIEHLGGTDMAYGIDNLTNGKGTYAETVIYGGTIKSTYRGVRQFLNGTEAQNILTVNGGTIAGSNKSIWMQEANAYANPGTLTVSEKAKLNGDVLLSVTSGATEWPVEVAIAASAVNGEVMSSNVPAGYTVVNVDGTWCVGNGIAVIGTEFYPTIADAIKAAEAGDIVRVVQPGTYTETLNIDKAIVVTGVTSGDGTQLVDVRGNLNITADGVTVANLIVQYPGTTVGYIDAKDVLIDNCKIVGSQGFHQSKTSGKVTFKNSQILGDNYGINFGGSAGGEIVIEDCVISGWTSFAASIKKVTMTGTTFAVAKDQNFIRFYQEEVIIDGCTFNEKMQIDIDADYMNITEITVTNSTFEGGEMGDIFVGYDLVRGAKVTVDGERVIRIARIKHADSTYTYFETLQDAVDGAQEGETISLFAGNYAQDVNINKDISLVGEGTTKVTLDGTVNITAGGVTVKNMTIQNGGINVSASSEISGINFGEKAGIDLTAEGLTLTVNNCTAANGDIKDMFDGADIANNTIIVDGVQLVCVAVAGGKNFETLAAAFEAAQDGDTVKLVANIELAETIKNTKKITLDLNGKTITGIDNNTSGNFYLIDNRGTLTVTGNGKITLTATTERNTSASSVILANNPGGKLVVQNGTFEHLGGSYMAYAIDNLTNGKGTYAETVIYGGTIKSTYRGVRQFLNGTEAQNILTVNGGTISGSNKSIFFHDPSKNANSGTLTVSENAKLNGDVYLYVTAGSTEWPVEVAIAENAVNGEILTGNVPEGYLVANLDGTWRVYSGVTVAEITEQPQSVTVKDGEIANVSFTAIGDDLTYTWYYKNPGATTFVKTNSFTGNTYSVAMSASRNGRQIYCEVTDKYGNTVTTDVVTLSVVAPDPVKIIKQPASVTVNEGEIAEVSFTAIGDGLTYTWYYKNPGASKFTKTNSFTGNTYSVAMSASRNGREIYCVVTDQYGNTVQTQTVTLSVITKNTVEITKQPVDVIVEEGETAKVSVTATGDGLTYTWYQKDKDAAEFTKAESFTGNTYAVEMTEAISGRQVYCVVADQYGNTAQTETVTLTMVEKNVAQITKQPVDVSVEEGQTAEVSFTATGAELTYTWYQKDKDAAEFTKAESFTGNTYSVKMAESVNGRQVYCVVADKYGNSVQTETVTLSMVVKNTVKITKQPVGVTVYEGETAEISFTATGDGLTYSWFYKHPGSDTYTQSDSFSGNTYSVKMNDLRNGRQVYCVVTDQYGNTAKTNVVTMNMIVKNIVQITKQPVDVTVEDGQTAKVSVTATGDGLTYTWYQKDKDAADFEKAADFTGNTYSVEMTESVDGRQVYCQVADKYGNTDNTAVVTLSMVAKNTVKITKQPANVTVNEGETAEVSFTATGDGLTYTWYYKHPGASSFTKTSTFTGNTYSVEMNESRDGRQVYCVVTDKYGNTAQTETVTLSMVAKNTVKITKQPANVTVNEGETAKVAFTATGDGLTYTWYYKNAGASSFTKTSTFTGNSYSVEMNESRDGRQVYCVVTDKYGNTAQTETVTLSMVVKNTVKITKQPTDVTVAKGETAKVSFKATGDGLTYTWYYKNPGASKFTKTDSFTGNSYSVAMSASRSGRQIYCVVTDQYGNTAKTEVVTLNMK